MLNKYVYWLIGERDQNDYSRQYAVRTSPSISFEFFLLIVKEVMCRNQKISGLTYSRGGKFENVVINSEESFRIAILSFGDEVNNPEKGIEVLMNPY